MPAGPAGQTPLRRAATGTWHRGAAGKLAGPCIAAIRRHQPVHADVLAAQQQWRQRRVSEAAALEAAFLGYRSDPGRTWT